MPGRSGSFTEKSREADSILGQAGCSPRSAPGRRYGVQHSMFAAPAQKPGVEVLPSAAQVLVAMQTPSVPLTVQEGGGVQHSMSAAPAQCPAVEVYPAMVAQVEVAMQVPSTPPAVQVTGGGGAAARVQHSTSAAPAQSPGVDV